MTTEATTTAATTHNDKRTVAQQLTGMARALAWRVTGNNVDSYDPNNLPDAQPSSPTVAANAGPQAFARVREFVRDDRGINAADKKALLKKVSVGWEREAEGSELDGRVVCLLMGEWTPVYV